MANTIAKTPAATKPIVALFEKHGLKPAASAECVRACLAQTGDHRPPVVVATSAGLAVVGVARNSTTTSRRAAAAGSASAARGE